MARFLPLLATSLLAFTALELLSTTAPGLTQPSQEQRLQPAQLTLEGGELLRQGTPKAAMAKFQQALQLARQLQLPQWEFMARLGLGRGHEALGQYDQALSNYQQALVLAQQLGSPLGEGLVRNNIGLIHQRLGEYTQAKQFYTQTLALARQVENRQLEGITLSNLGALAIAVGQYPQALKHYEQVLAIARATDNQAMAATVLNNLGTVHQSMGQYAQAQRFYEQALAMTRASGNRPEMGAALVNLGSVQVRQQQYDQAIKSYQQALVIIREVGDRAAEGTALNNLAEAYRALQQFEPARQHYQQALAIHREVNNRPMEGLTLSNLGAVHDDQGQSAKALAYYQQALAIQREIGDRVGEGTTLNNMGLSYIGLDQLQAAEKSLFAGIKIFESLRPGLTDANKVSLFDQFVSAYPALQTALIAQNKTNQALEVAERGRARAFAELLAQRLQTDTAAGSPSQPPDVAQMRQIAKTQQATLVQYSIMEGLALYIWVIPPDGPITFRLTELQPLAQKRQTLAQLVLAARCAEGDVNCLTGVFQRGFNLDAQQQQSTPLPVSRTTTPYLRQLHQLLIAPIADVLPTNPNQRVIFIPQSALFLAPFPALMDAKGTYLIEKHTILTAPSIQVLAQTRQRQQQLSGTGETLIVGNPTMPDRNLKPLPGAEREAKTVGEFLQAPILIGGQATEAIVKQRLEQANLIHLATHGLLNDQNALDSALALTPGGGEDGFLTAAELFQMNLQADLVVLSACDTGKGRITGDGVIGLSRSLIAAGVPSVIVSLWAVPDAPTAALMVEFYRQRQQGLDKAQALRQAMLVTKEKHPHPINWAAFTLIGEAL